MENRGIEPRLEGYTDDDAYKWVIQSMKVFTCSGKVWCCPRP